MRTELIIGATGTGSPSYQDPALVKAALGVKFKLVTGYKGGPEITLAMERGEVHGRAMSSNAWDAQRPDWVRDGKLAHLVQLGPGDPKRMAGMPRLIDLAPPDRAAAIEKAVTAEVTPVLSEEFTRFVGEVMATPESVLVEVRRILGQGS